MIVGNLYCCTISILYSTVFTLHPLFEAETLQLEGVLSCPPGWAQRSTQDILWAAANAHMSKSMSWRSVSPLSPKPLSQPEWKEPLCALQVFLATHTEVIMETFYLNIPVSATTQWWPQGMHLQPWCHNFCNKKVGFARVLWFRLWEKLLVLEPDK